MNLDQDGDGDLSVSAALSEAGSAAETQVLTDAQRGKGTRRSGQTEDTVGAAQGRVRVRATLRIRDPSRPGPARPSGRVEGSAWRLGGYSERLRGQVSGYRAVTG